MEITQKPVVFLSSNKYVINNPNPLDRQITDEIFARCFMRQDDYNEFLEWSREKSHYNTT
jgi:hypothetical protein